MAPSASLRGFSALQRAEIAEMKGGDIVIARVRAVSVLFNEPKLLKSAGILAAGLATSCFSALQRAEIAEIELTYTMKPVRVQVSVLFNEPKLLKYE